MFLESVGLCIAAKMKYSLASIAWLVTLGECVSLPPLIPSIPGVTDPLATNAPPLPILQVPTPPLESPPFTPSNIKPKKIGYFWTGSGDKNHKGTLSWCCTVVSVSLTTFQTSWLLTVSMMYANPPPGFVSMSVNSSIDTK